MQKRHHVLGNEQMKTVQNNFKWDETKMNLIFCRYNHTSKRRVNVNLITFYNNIVLFTLKKGFYDCIIYLLGPKGSLNAVAKWFRL